MSIKDFIEKIKSRSFEALLDQKIFVVALLLLTATLSFGLGRLAGIESTRTPARIVFPEESTAAVANAFAEKGKGGNVETAGTVGGKYVASKNGTKYHLPWCAGAKQISDANKIWFETKQEAEKKGYTPASNCKGI